MQEFCVLIGFNETENPDRMEVRRMAAKKKAKKGKKK